MKGEKGKKGKKGGPAEVKEKEKKFKYILHPQEMKVSLWFEENVKKAPLREEKKALVKSQDQRGHVKKFQITKPVRIKLTNKYKTPHRKIVSRFNPYVLKSMNKEETCEVAKVRRC